MNSIHYHVRAKVKQKPAEKKRNKWKVGYFFFNLIQNRLKILICPVFNLKMLQISLWRRYAWKNDQSLIGTGNQFKNVFSICQRGVFLCSTGYGRNSYYVVILYIMTTLSYYYGSNSIKLVSIFSVWKDKRHIFPKNYKVCPN